MQAPTRINKRREESYLEIEWRDGLVGRLDYRFLREQCACAHCVHELTGERILDPASIPSDIHVAEMSLVGAYALRIDWSDGHNTGLYTWDLLRGLSEGDSTPAS